MENKGDAIESASFSALGRYHVRKHIGRGGMADVWLCEDPRLHRMVAIKTLPAHNQHNHGFLFRFKQEAQAAAALHHPHILAIHDYGEQRIETNEAIAYIVMPYITGGSLADQLEQHVSIGPERAMSYLTQAAQAIDYAHDKGIIHRDIKPGNMLLRNEDWLLLSDFGIARLLSTNERFTKTGVGFGTPDYMAPEQAQGRAVIASDNYSLAVIAYQLFTGHLPFNADTGYAVTIQHMTLEPPPPRQLNPRLSPATAEVLLRGLTKRPEERIPSATAFVAALQSTLHVRAYAATTNTVYPPQTASPAEIGGNTAANTVTRISSVHEPRTPAADLTAKQPGATLPITRRQLLMGGSAAALIAGGGIATWALVNSQNSGQQRSVVNSRATKKPVRPPDPNAPAIMIQKQHINPANALAWAAGKNVLASIGDQDTLFLWDVQQLQQQPDAPTALAQRSFDKGSQLRLAWSPDGSKLAVGNTGEAKLTTLQQTIDVYAGDLSVKASGIAGPLTTDNTFLLSGLGWLQKSILTAVSSRMALNDDHHFDLWTVNTSQAQQALQSTTVVGHLGGPLTSSPQLLAVSPDGKTLALALIDGIAIGQIVFTGQRPQWQQVTNKLSFKDILNQPDAVMWFSNADIVGSYYTSTASSTLSLWSIKARSKTPIEEVTIDAQLTTMASCPAPTSTLVAAGTKDGRVYVWNLAKNSNPVGILNSGGIDGEVLALAWSNDGQWLAASYKDNDASVVIWKIRGRGY